MPAGYTSRGAMSYSMSDELEDAVIRFNNTDPEYRIVLKPVSYSSSDERDRLLIELATGSDVDVIDTSILPENALKGGLLTDMLPYLDADGAVSRDDFIAPLFNAMLKNGGLYEYTDKFTLMTLISDAGLYPGRQDWTADYIAQQRAEQVAEIQSRIMDAYNESCIGKTMQVLCEGFDPDEESYYGRTYADSPDIDGKIWFTAERHIKTGDFVDVRVVDTYDGELVSILEEDYHDDSK